MKKEEVGEEYSEEEERRRKEKELKVTVPEKEEEITEITPPKKEEERAEIPFIKLEKVSELGLKKLELCEEIPKIEKEGRTIPVPIIKLQEPSLMLREYELDYKIPHIEKTKRLLTVPIIRAKLPPKPPILLAEFDKEIRKPSKIVLPKVRVPIYQKGIIASPKFLLESFDSTISEQLKERLERKEEAKRELPIESIEKIEAEPGVPSLGAEGEEVPELFNLIFSTSGGKIDSDNPKVIGLKELENDAHIGVLRTLCMRIYREKVGGKPKPIIISKIRKDEFKREVEKWMEAEDRIFSVGLEESEGLDKDFWDSVQDRIEELFSQRFGFIIFNKPIFFFPKHHIVDIINIEPKKMSLELKKEIASIIWGFVRLDDVDSPRFDHIFEVARKRFETKLREIGEPYLTATKRDKGLHEADDLHYPIKLFIVKYLAREMNLKHLDQIKEMIQTEYEGLGDYRPDIYVAPSAEKFANQIFEVETLFGQGNYPLKKIDETIEKYEKASWAHKVNIILDNLTFLRHINELRKKMNLHRSLQIKGKRKFDLEFYTLDLQNEKLISLLDVAEKLKQCLEH
ncbi:MAG: hypothetical protein QXN53_06120 [Thermoproteota archaeon]